MTKFFAYPKATIWSAGLIIFALFVLISNVLVLNYLDQDIMCGHSGPRAVLDESGLDCTFSELIGSVGLIFFVLMFVGTVVKLNQIPSISLIVSVLCFLVAFIGFVFIGGS